MPQDVTVMSREHIEQFLLWQIQTRKPNTAMTRYKSLNVFFNWLVEEGEISDPPGSPMKRLKPPKVPENPPDVLTEDQLRAILKTCSGKDFLDRRDTAIIRLLIDTGCRRQELCDIQLSDVDLDLGVINIQKSKGGKSRVIVFGKKCALALDRYLRAQSRHLHADSPYLWLGSKGKLSVEGLYKTVTKRCDEAGVTNAYIHLFRHSFADMWLRSGGSETDLQRLSGWTSTQVMRRYGSSAADARARQHFKELSPGDRI